MEKERNHLIDAIKCLACFGVVMLHMPAAKFQKEIIDIQDMLGRCGVPLFFMISGYFAAKHIEKDPSSSRWFFKRAVKMLQQFVIFGKRQIIMRLDTRLLQPFASWSNSL